MDINDALNEYQADAARCCDSCLRTALLHTSVVAFTHGWLKRITGESSRIKKLEAAVAAARPFVKYHLEVIQTTQIERTLFDALRVLDEENQYDSDH